MRTLMILIMEYLRVYIVLLGFFGCTKSQIRHGKTIFFHKTLRFIELKQRVLIFF